MVVNRQETRPADELPEHRPSDPRLATVLPQRVLNARTKELTGHRILLGYQTTNSRMTLAVGVDHVIDAACQHQAVGSVDDDTGELLITADAQAGVLIRITKYATYQASRTIPVPELVDRCRRPSIGRFTTASTPSWRRSGRISTGSGTAPTSVSIPG
jgi:alpha,alpha-trehalose phosphorylase